MLKYKPVVLFFYAIILITCYIKCSNLLDPSEPGNLVPKTVDAEKFDPAARAAAIAPFIDEQTLIIVHIDMTRIAPAAIAKQVLEVIFEACYD